MEKTVIKAIKARIKRPSKEAVEADLKNGLSVVGISEKYGSHKMSIYRWIRKYGLKEVGGIAKRKKRKNTIEDWVIEQNKIERICKCGCGNRIEIKIHHKKLGIPEIISGHNTFIQGGPGNKIKLTEEQTAMIKSGVNDSTIDREELAKKVGVTVRVMKNRMHAMGVKKSRVGKTEFAETKVCNKCGEEFPNTDEYFQKILKPLKNGGMALNGMCHCCLNMIFHKKRAKEHGLKFDFTVEDWKYSLWFFDGVCALCGGDNKEYGQPLHKSHIKSIKNRGDCVKENMIPLCRKCNFSMGPNNLFEWKRLNEFDEVNIKRIKLYQTVVKTYKNVLK